MILNTPTRKLQVVLATTSALNSMPVTIDYVDMTATTTDADMVVANTNGTTAVDILPAPPLGTKRKVNSISIYNRDTATKTVTVILDDAGVQYHLVDITLQVDDTLGYTDAGGWYTVDLSGNRKTVVGTSASAIADAIHTSPNKTTTVSADEFALWDSVSGLLNRLSFANLKTALGIGVVMSMVRLNTAGAGAAGYGSTNTAIRRFTTVVTNQGTDITYADSATLGASFTINTGGVYAISYADNFNTASAGGISLNSAQLTTAIDTITAADRVIYSVSGIVSPLTYAPIDCSASLYLAAGAVIRPHTNGAASGAGIPAVFTITKISP